VVVFALADAAVNIMVTAHAAIAAIGNERLCT
jgi:hypothetical protein